MEHRAVHPLDAGRRDHLAADALDGDRHRPDGRRLKDFAQRKFDLQLIANTRRQLRGEQRVPALVEEVVGGADRTGAEELGHHPGDRTFDRRTRPRVGTVGTVVFDRKRGNVDLAVGCAREGRQRGKDPRDHVRRQTSGDGVAKLARRRDGGRVRSGRPERDQRPIREFAPHHHERLPHRGVRLHRGAYLAQLHAIPAQFDLLVRPTEVLERAVAKQSRAVAGAVHPPARCSPGIGPESIRRQVRLCVIAPRESIARDPQLARRPKRCRLELLVQHPQTRAAERSPHVRRPRPVLASKETGADRRFGRAIPVEERATQRPVPRELLGARLAGHDDRLERREWLPWEDGQRRRRQGDHRDPALVQIAQQIRPRMGLARAPAVEPRTLRQRHEDLGHRGVEGERGQLGHPIVSPHREGGRLLFDQPTQRRVPDDDALRDTGRARRVDDVRGICAARSRVRGRPVRERQLLERGGRLSHLGQIVGARRRRDDHVDVGVEQDERKALGRVRQVEGDVRRSRLHHPENRDDGGHRTGQRHADARLEPDSQGRQSDRDPGGSSIELRVRDRLVGVGDRDCLGGCRSLGGHAFVHARQRPRVVRRAAAERDDRRPLGVGDQRNGPDPDSRIAHRGAQDPFELPGELNDRLAVEEVRVVLERRRQLVGALVHADPEVVLGGVHAEVHPVEPQRPEYELRGGRVLQREDDLKEGPAALVTRGGDRLDDLLEREVLVLVSVERHLLHPRDQRADTRLTVDQDPQRQRIEKAANQLLELWPRTRRDRRADDQILLARAPVQEHADRREQDHVQRRAAVPREVLELAQQVAPEHDAVRGPGGALHGRAGPVGRPVEERRGPRELLFPVRDQALAVGPGEELALPQRVVAVLQAKRRDLLDVGPGLERAQVRLVQAPDLVHQDSERPRVADRVMHAQGEHVLPRRRRAQQDDPPQGATGEIEGAPRKSLDPRGARGVGVVPGRPVDPGNVDLSRRADDLHDVGPPRLEGGTQSVVAGDHARDGPLERDDRKRARETHRRRHVVRRRQQLLEEPQAPLRERQRHVACGGVAPERRRRFAPAIQRRHRLGEPLDRLRLEQKPYGKVDAGAFPDARDDARCQERVAADREEVVLHAHAVAVEELAPEGREGRLQVVSRRHVRPCRAPAIDLAQRAAVHLAVRGEGQPVEHDDRIGRQVRRKIGCQAAP